MKFIKALNTYLTGQACLCTPANAGFFVFGLREIH
jgi:hypothetical protein